MLNFQLLGQVLVDLLQANLNVGGFQNILFVAGRQRRQRRGDKVNHAAGVIDVSGDGRELIRQSRRARHNLLEQRQHVALQGFNLGILGDRYFRNGLHRRAHKGRQLGVFGDLHPFQTFGKNKQALVGHAHHFVHHRQAADGKKVGRLG